MNGRPAAYTSMSRVCLVNAESGRKGRERANEPSPGLARVQALQVEDSSGSEAGLLGSLRREPVTLP